MPRPVISVSTSHNDQLQAAKLLSKRLTELGYRHGFIGGFAWALLGSQRPTEDIDILIELKDGQSMLSVRERVEELDIHFATAGLKFFFVKHPNPQFRDEELVSHSRENVLIETLSAGSLGLPRSIPAVLTIHGINLLHPTVLVLTKLKRWCTNSSSTRPKTQGKRRIDRTDITFMLKYLTDQSLKIEFENYAGKSKMELLSMIAQFHAKLVEEGEEVIVDTLRAVMDPDDWNVVKTLPPPTMEVKSQFPPDDPNTNTVLEGSNGDC